MRQALESAISLAYTLISQFYVTYPRINRPRELYAYCRAQNKSFQSFFLMFVIGMVIAHLVTTLALLLDGFGTRLISISLLIVIPFDSMLFLLFVFVLHIGQAASTAKKEDLVAQERVRTRFMICGFIPTCMFIVGSMGVLEIRDKYAESSVVWLFYTTFQILISSWNIGGITYKLSTFIVFNLGFCYVSYLNDYFNDYFALRLLLPTVIAVLGVIFVDRYTKENFLLRLAVKHQRNMYQNFFQQIQDPVMIFNSKELIFQNRAALARIGTNKANYYDRLREFVSSRGWTLEDYAKAWLDEEVSEFMGTAAHQEIYQWYRGGAHESDKRVVKVTLIESTDIRAGGDSNGSGNKASKFANRAVSLFMHDITEELQNEEKKAQGKFKNMLLFSLSHELKTPLNIFQRFLAESKQLLKHNHDYDSLKDAHTEARGAWRYLRNKINDILDYAQILANEFALHNSSFSTRRFISYLRKVTTFLLTGKRKSVRTQFHIGENVPDFMYADRDRLEQVLFNFLSNAAKFTEAGEISFSVSRDVGQDYIKFEVKDTGCGMSKETLDCLFTPRHGEPDSVPPSPFASALASTLGSPHHPGLRPAIPGRLATRLGGLGLTVSRMICEKLGADISVKSELGQGSAFSIRVPVLVQPEGSPAAGRGRRTLLKRVSISQGNSPPIPDEEVGLRKTVPAREWTGTCRIRGISVCSKEKTRGARIALVVDDNDFNRYVAERMIKKFGFEVRMAENGKVAIEALRRVQDERREEDESTVVVFMDIDMPVMDGIEATIKIRRDDRPPRPIIVALTAFSAESERRKCFEAGMDAFIDKPLTKERLYETLCNLELMDA